MLDKHGQDALAHMRILRDENYRVRNVWAHLRLNPVRHAYEPERVVSIVSSSRSGSTVLKHALCLHPELCSLAGEEEPYYKLARNGYPWHDSDEFHVVNGPDEIRSLINTELFNVNSAYNRGVLQAWAIEEPPFVEPVMCRRTHTLVLKTPQNCYRRGVMEELFPDSEIIYLAVERDPRATVNGLLDGWRSGNFTARRTERGWWCFDMPPGWSWDQLLLERCIVQARSAARFIKEDYSDAQKVQFEDFEQDWRGVCVELWKSLALGTFDPPPSPLPELSTTHPPEPERWRKTRPWLGEVLEDWRV